MRAVKLGLLAALMFAAPSGGAIVQAPQAAQAAQPAAPPANSRIVVRSGDVSELGAESAGLAFVTGQEVRIAAQAGGDVFAAGRDLRVEGASLDHLFLAGRELDLAPAAVRDLIAAGGHVRLRSGAVGDDVVAAGGEIGLGPGARIEGSAVLAGGRLLIEAPVGRALMAGGGRVELNAPVAGDARIRADEIVIGPQARIGGDLHVRGERIEISPAAVVQGRTAREVVTPEKKSPARFVLPATLFALGVLVMIGVVAAAGPLLMDGVDRRLRSRFWPTLGIGALVLLLGPPVILALLASVLGAPLGLVLALAFLLAVPLAFAGVSYVIGQLIRGRLARAHAAVPPRWPARLGWTALAALLLMIASAIPYIGGLIWLVALAAGMGGLAAQLLPPRAEPVPAAA